VSLREASRLSMSTVGKGWRCHSRRRKWRLARWYWRIPEI